MAALRAPLQDQAQQAEAEERRSGRHAQPRRRADARPQHRALRPRRVVGHRHRAARRQAGQHAAGAIAVGGHRQAGEVQAGALVGAAVHPVAVAHLGPVRAGAAAAGLDARFQHHALGTGPGARGQGVVRGMQAKAEHRRAQEDEDRDQQPLQHARPRPPAQVRMSNSQRRGTPSISEVPRPRRRTCSPCISSASTPWLAPVRLMLSAW